MTSGELIAHLATMDSRGQLEFWQAVFDMPIPPAMRGVQLQPKATLGAFLDTLERKGMVSANRLPPG